jgi:hypothetical protein
VARVVGSRGSPSRAALLRYYRRYATESGAPERRTFNFLVAVSEDDAVQGKLALEHGQSWKATAEEHSYSEVVKQFGWRMADVTPRYVRETLDGRAAKVAFAAPPHEVVGPEPLAEGWLVFEVVDVTPRFRPAFGVVREAIRNRLIEQRRSSALESFRRALRAKYAERTRCAPSVDLAWCRPLP